MGIRRAFRVYICYANLTDETGLGGAEQVSSGNTRPTRRWFTDPLSSWVNVTCRTRRWIVFCWSRPFRKPLVRVNSNASTLVVLFDSVDRSWRNSVYRDGRTGPDPPHRPLVRGTCMPFSTPVNGVILFEDLFYIYFVYVLASARRTGKPSRPPTPLARSPLT